jgi:hypothetical protein
LQKETPDRFSVSAKHVICVTHHVLFGGKVFGGHRTIGDATDAFALLIEVVDRVETNGDWRYAVFPQNIQREKLY